LLYPLSYGSKNESGFLLMVILITRDRTDSGKFDGRIKRDGNIHQESLETTDRETANRKLKDFIRKIESKAVEGSEELAGENVLSAGAAAFQIFN
jgi:hypothetical protein